MKDESVRYKFSVVILLVSNYLLLENVKKTYTFVQGSGS